MMATQDGEHRSEPPTGARKDRIKMSVTISAFPFLLLSSVAGAGVDIAAINLQAEMGTDKALSKEVVYRLLEFEGQSFKAELLPLNQEFETVFMNRELLVKTLKEHGCDHFKENFDDSFSCKVREFNVDLYRKNTDEPYKIKISCAQDVNCNEFLSDLNSEYALNTQEETYIKIKERLCAQNLKIDAEEILEDNTIMLTINLG